VQLGEAGTRLCFEVSDDGVGLAHGERSGVGIDNMQDRIGSVGGWIVVEPGSPQGTSVRGHVQLTDVDSPPTTR
jgi:signal transduction histidine kinase